MGKRRFVAKGEEVQMCVLFDFLKVLQTFCFQAKKQGEESNCKFLGALSTATPICPLGHLLLFWRNRTFSEFAKTFSNATSM